MILKIIIYSIGGLITILPLFWRDKSWFKKGIISLVVGFSLFSILDYAFSETRDTNISIDDINLSIGFNKKMEFSSTFFSKSERKWAFEKKDGSIIMESEIRDIFPSSFEADFENNDGIEIRIDFVIENDLKHEVIHIDSLKSIHVFRITYRQSQIIYKHNSKNEIKTINDLENEMQLIPLYAFEEKSIKDWNVESKLRVKNKEYKADSLFSKSFEDRNKSYQVFTFRSFVIKK